MKFVLKFVIIIKKTIIILILPNNHRLKKEKIKTKHRFVEDISTFEMSSLKKKNMS